MPTRDGSELLADKDPAELALRRVRTELKRARMASGLTQQEVAAKLYWSPSKVLRIEAGAVGVSTADLRALLSLYHIADEGFVENLAETARAAMRQPGNPYR